MLGGQEQPAPSWRTAIDISICIVRKRFKQSALLRFSNSASVAWQLLFPMLLQRVVCVGVNYMAE